MNVNWMSVNWALHRWLQVRHVTIGIETRRGEMADQRNKFSGVDIRTARDRISDHLRLRRFELVNEMLMSEIRRKGNVRVLDIGGHPAYWEFMEPGLRSDVEITMLNIPGAPGTDVEWSPGLRIIQRVGDGCHMPEFADQSFDIAHSNSVIEHVGSLERMISFGAETRRVGRAYYLQTPNLYFPIDPHYGVPFIHWLPKGIRAQIIGSFNVGYRRRKSDVASAFSTADHIEIIQAHVLKRVLPDAELLKERIGPFTKSLICVRYG